MRVVHVSAHFCCHGEHQSPGRHHACGNGFSRLPRGPCSAFPIASSRRSGGWITSGRYYDDECFLRTYSRPASFSLSKLGIVACRESVSAGASSGLVKAAFRDFCSSHLADDRLFSARIDRDVLHGHRLFAARAIAFKCIELCGKISAPSLEAVLRATLMCGSFQSRSPHEVHRSQCTTSSWAASMASSTSSARHLITAAANSNPS